MNMHEFIGQEPKANVGGPKILLYKDLPNPFATTTRRQEMEIVSKIVPGAKITFISYGGEKFTILPHQQKTK